MNERYLKATSLFLASLIAATSFAACSSKKEESVPNNKPAETAQSNKVYPISTNVTLKYWSDLNPNVSQNYKTLGDTPFAKELEKRTGVKVEYLHPASGQKKDVLNVMIASGDLPDVIEYGWLRDFNGGPDAAINNGSILKLNETIDKYAPNLKNYLSQNPDINKMVKTDSGSYYGFPFVKGDQSLLTTYGLAMRGDWLKELNLEVPTTIDEWYTVLKAFKEKKNASAPFSYSGSGTTTFTPYNSGMIIGAYGITKGFFLDNGKIKYGAYEGAYKSFLTTMAKWYKEGLLDRNFSMNDSKAMDAAVLNDQVGAMPAYPGSTFGTYIPALKAKNPNATIIPVPYPVLKKGDKPQFSAKVNPYDGSCALAISANSKNAEIATRWLDYGYSQEGQELYNFGIEGVSYKMENGSPKMTDEVLKNPEKLSVSYAWSKYARAPYMGPFVQRKEYLEQYYALDEQKAALKVWSDTDMDKHLLPAISPSQEESAAIAKILNNVDTYVNEYTLKVIYGTESLDNFDKYVDQLKKMDIEKAIAAYQKAYDNYNKR